MGVGATSPAWLAADLARLVRLLRDGALVAEIAARMPLEEAARGLALAESGTISGKIILTP